MLPPGWQTHPGAVWRLSGPPSWWHAGPRQRTRRLRAHWGQRPSPLWGWKERVRYHDCPGPHRDCSFHIRYHSPSPSPWRPLNLAQKSHPGECSQISTHPQSEEHGGLMRHQKPSAWNLTSCSPGRTAGEDGWRWGRWVLWNQTTSKQTQGQKQRGESSLRWRGLEKEYVNRRSTISSQPCKQTMKPHKLGREMGTGSREQSGSSPTGPSWETVCMLKESSWPGFCSSSRRLEKALAIILLFLIRLGSSSLCPVNLRAERVGAGGMEEQLLPLKSCKRPANPFPPGKEPPEGLKGPEE